MKLTQTLLLSLALLFSMGCPSSVTSPASTPEQRVVAYMSVVCGSDTVKGANYDLTQTVITLDQMALIDKTTTRSILGYTGQVAVVCSGMSPILQSTDPWATKAGKIAMLANSVGPANWLVKLTRTAIQEPWIRPLCRQPRPRFPGSRRS